VGIGRGGERSRGVITLKMSKKFWECTRPILLIKAFYDKNGRNEEMKDDVDEDLAYDM